MKILQIVTLITPENAYGGPVRVALNQVRGLRKAGHEVDLIAGSYGFARTPEAVDGVSLRLFPAIKLIPGTGFAGLFSPRMLAFLGMNLNTYDVVHIHLARDLITLPSAYLTMVKGVPYVLQTHGMIDESDRTSAHLLDKLLTRRVIHGAGIVFHLTPEELASISSLYPSARQANLPNGVPIPEDLAHGGQTRDVEVLYLARLHERKRPMKFVEAAKEVANTSDNVSFTLVGPDEGQGQLVSDYIKAHSLERQVRWEGPLSVDATLARMARAAIYVLPSVDEPFPMSVLEAISLGLPVIITKSNGLAPFLEKHNAGLVIEDKPGALGSAIRNLLSDDDLRTTLAANARRLAINEFSIDSVIRTIMLHYERVASASVSSVRATVRKGNH